MTPEQLIALRGLIAIGSGLDSSVVIPARDKGALPIGLFASVFVVHDRAIGTPAITQLDAVQVQAETREAIVSVEWLRSGAYQSALSFGSWIVSDLGRMDARGAGMDIDIHSPIADASSVIIDEYEARADCQLRVGYVRVSQYDTGAIERVPLAVNERAQVDIDAG